MFKLYTLLQKLRDPDTGCPWDKAQTIESLQSALLEETYEVLDAINKEDDEGLEEELGDLFLVMGLQICIAEEEGRFTLETVLEKIRAKIIRRHPHIFGSEKASSPEEVKKIWQKVKESEGKNTNSETNKHKSLFEKHSSINPVIDSRKIIKVMTAKNFTWDNIEQIYDKIKEELKEVHEAENLKERQGEIGDLIFSVLNLAQEYNIDPSIALDQANKKIKKRFDASYQKAGYKDGDVKSYNRALLNECWKSIKKDEPQ